MNVHLTDAERSAVMCAAMDCGPCQQGTWDVEGCHCAEDLSQAVEAIVSARLAAQKVAIATAIENAPPGDRIAHMYFAEGIRTAARIVREFGTEES